jgi:thiamine biosynthesis lipoprotein
MRTFRIPFEAMACHCEVVLAVPDAQHAHRIAQLAVAEVQRIQSKYSRYRPDSILSHINALAGRAPVDCDDETWSLLDYANTLHQASDGLFDVTAGALRKVWNFSVARVPSAEELARCLPLVGWSQVVRSNHQIQLPVAGMEIDFGGFGKEYAADRAAAVLAGQGVENGYVNLGGDLRVLGPKPDGQAWMIGIQHPRKAADLLATIPVHSGALATSGDYERYFELVGQRYCHILDPRTGLPVTRWQSISVLAPMAVVAGNCSTIAMLKQEEGLAFLESSGMNYLAVDHNGTICQKNSS